MKKIFSIFFTVLFVFAAITLAVSAAKIDVDDKNIHYSNLLDFNPETNEYWAKQNEDGTWTHIEIDEYSQPRDAEGKLCSPILSTKYSSYAARKWSLIEGGEVLRVQSTDASVYPGVVFVLDAAHNGDFPVGQASSSPARAEFVKIRVRNLSTCDQISFGFTMNHTNGGTLMPLSTSTLTVDDNGKTYESSGEWQTYVFSMYEVNKNTNYNDGLYDPTNENDTPKSRWPGNLYEFAIYPFGYAEEDGTGNYPGAIVDIDYVVIGSKDYVTNYQSALEIKESNIQSLELVAAPTKTNYVVGEVLDLAGLELKATFKDGSTEVLDSASASVATFEKVENKVTLKYGAETVDFAVNVIDIDGIEMNAFPEKQVFEVATLADGFVSDGYEVKVNYKDGAAESRILDNANFKFTGDFTKAGKTTVTVYYFGKSTSFEIDIIQVVDIKIEPTKTYRYGKSPVIDDFAITFVYSDGSELASGDSDLELTYDEDALKKFVMMGPGKTNVTISATSEDYEDIAFTKEVEVTVEAPIGIEVTTAPKKTEYQPNETFDPTGMRVDLIYDNGNGKTTKVQIKNDALTFRVSTATSGEKNVTIRTDIAGLDEIFNEIKPKTTITVLGNAGATESSSSTTASTPSTNPGASSDFNALPIIIAVVAVVVIAGAVAVIVVVKKKKK